MQFRTFSVCSWDRKMPVFDPEKTHCQKFIIALVRFCLGFSSCMLLIRRFALFFSVFHINSLLSLFCFYLSLFFYILGKPLKMTIHISVSIFYSIGSISNCSQYSFQFYDCYLFLTHLLSSQSLLILAVTNSWSSLMFLLYWRYKAIYYILKILVKPFPEILFRIMHQLLYIVIFPFLKWGTVSAAIVFVTRQSI